DLLTKVTYRDVLYKSVCRSLGSLGAPAEVHGNSAQLMSDTLCGRAGSPAGPASLSPRLWTAGTTSATLLRTDIASGPLGASVMKRAADDDTDAGKRWGAAAVIRDYGGVAPRAMSLTVEVREAMRTYMQQECSERIGHLLLTVSPGSLLVPQA